MKEGPILFSAPMIQAIRRDVDPKTQTRRVVKPQPTGEPRPLREWVIGLAHACGDDSPLDVAIEAHIKQLEGRVFPFTTGHGTLTSPKCRYQKGDALWVKETHYLFGHWVKDGVTKTGKQRWSFRNEVKGEVLYEDCKPAEVKTTKTERGWFKRSSLFMPYWAGRTFLKITEEPRPERLQEISARDAYAEGVIVSHDPIPVGLTWEATVGSAALAAYQRLWDEINGKTHPWAENPWIWRLEFRRIEKEANIGKRHQSNPASQ